MLKLQEKLIVICISALIGLGVGSFFSFINNGDIVFGISTGAISGAVIGLFSQYIFMLVFLNLSKHPLLAFSFVIIVVGLGTAGFCLLWKVPFPLPGMAIVGVSEVFGIIATGLGFYNYLRLNRMLKRKKDLCKKDFTEKK